MPANYGSQSAAEQAADLKRVCLRVINLNEISHISCIKCEVNISIINVSFHSTPGAPWESGLRHDSNVICVHTYWGTCLKRKRWCLSDTRLFQNKRAKKSVGNQLTCISTHMSLRRGLAANSSTSYNEVRTRAALGKNRAPKCALIWIWQVICIAIARHA